MPIELSFKINFMNYLLVLKNKKCIAKTIFFIIIFLTQKMITMAQKAPDYSIDPHLSVEVKAF
jgi:hypothetical protein